jgi:hypothetical protein
MRRAFASYVTAAALFPLTAPAADLHSARSDGLAAIDLVGVIRKGDYQRFATAAESNKDVQVMVRLNSDGGDVHEAIAIGLKARAMKMWVIVLGRARCVSACVLILAGGVDRTVYGRVGIHRPYLETDSATTELEQRRNYGDL